LYFGVRGERWRPTRHEIVRQGGGDREMFLRPGGLVIFLIALGGFVALAIWLEQFAPGISGRRSPLNYIFGLVFVSLLSIRKVRNSIFYTGEPPATDKEKKPEG
jgi:hypothetical protein